MQEESGKAAVDPGDGSRGTPDAGGRSDSADRPEAGGPTEVSAEPSAEPSAGASAGASAAGDSLRRAETSEVLAAAAAADDEERDRAAAAAANRPPLPVRPQVQFLHVTDPQTWTRVEDVLSALAEACEEGRRSDSGANPAKELADRVAAVRSAAGALPQTAALERAFDKVAPHLPAPAAATSASASSSSTLLPRKRPAAAVAKDAVAPPSRKRPAADEASVPLVTEATQQETQQETQQGSQEAHHQPSMSASSRRCWEQMLTWLAHLVLQLPALFAEGLPLLDQNREAQVLLSRRHCTALLAAGFFGCLPNPEEQQRACGDGGKLPKVDFSYVLDSDVEKVSCFLAYFSQVAAMGATDLAEVVSFARRRVDPGGLGATFWRALEDGLEPAKVCDGEIEHSHANLQADFANKFLGGGVMHRGNVQEEIRFLMCPECIVGMLLCPRLLAHEVFFIVGAKQYSTYKGYGSTFEFEGFCKVRFPGKADKLKRRGPHIVAFDALSFPGTGNSQYKEACVLRELIKAYAACQGDPEEVAGPRRKAFATGNWGCGVFGGDPQLKSLIQWLAASAVGRELHYYSYRDERMEQLDKIFTTLRGKKIRCCQLYDLLLNHTKGSVFDKVLASVASEEKT